MLVLQSFMAPLPQTGDLDDKEALGPPAHLLLGSMVGHVIGHISLIKKNSFVIRLFPLPQKMPGQPPFNAVQNAKM